MKQAYVCLHLKSVQHFAFATAGPTKASSFKQQQNINLNIDKPNDVPIPGQEPPQVEPIMTPTAAEVEAAFEKELKQLQEDK